MFSRRASCRGVRDRGKGSYYHRSGDACGKETLCERKSAIGLCLTLLDANQRGQASDQEQIEGTLSGVRVDDGQRLVRKTGVLQEFEGRASLHECISSIRAASEDTRTRRRPSAVCPAPLIAKRPKELPHLLLSDAQCSQAAIPWFGKCGGRECVEKLIARADIDFKLCDMLLTLSAVRVSELSLS